MILCYGTLNIAPCTECLIINFVKLISSDRKKGFEKVKIFYDFLLKHMHVWFSVVGFLKNKGEIMKNDSLCML